MSLLNRLSIDNEVAKSIVDARFGGRIDSILDAWEASGLATADKKAPDRSTLRRWISGSLPRSQHDLLSLCSLLDTDPFALVVVTNGGHRLRGASAFSAGRALLWLTPGLGFVHQFFGRQELWPPVSLGDKASPVLTYFPGGWHTIDFTHDATHRVGFYQRVRLSTAPQDRPTRVWHFAYRPLIDTGRWLHYGIVARYRDVTRLLNARGYLVERPNTDSADTFVETWFGPGPALFRVASLHPFECELVDGASKDDNGLRFIG